MTVIEPPRGYADFGGKIVEKKKAPPVLDVLSFMFRRPSFVHLSLAAALHSVVWYASGAFNNAFFQRSHGMSALQAGGGFRCSARSAASGRSSAATWPTG